MRPGFRAGNLRQQGDFQAVTVGKGAGGGITRTWADLAGATGVYCQVRGLPSGEQDATSKGGRVAKRVIEVVLRYLPGIDPVATRFRYDGQVYDIKSVDNVEERDAWLVLVCETGVDSAN